MFGALGIGFLIAVPWLGWLPVLLVGTQVIVYGALRPIIATSPRPVFLLGVAGLPARFGTNGVVAGVVLTEALIVGSTVGVDPAAFGADPSFVLITAFATFGLAAFVHALMQAESQKRSDSVVDSLTGLLNRRGMEARFAELSTTAAATGAPLTLLLCDLDHFKSINDEYGHQRGDDVLRATADAIRGCLQAGEQAFRVGGEEFLILAPGCDGDSAGLTAERVRAAIEDASPGGLPVTASLGAGVAVGDEIDFDRVFSVADRALYDAKRAGRNRVALQPVAA